MNGTLQRSLWSRPLVLAIGGIGAGLANPGLQPGLFLEILIVSLVVPGVLAAMLGQRRRLAPAATAVSIAIGLFGWALFALLTGGVRSPLVVGFLLEILVSVVSTSVRGVAATTAGAALLLIGLGSITARDDLGLLALEVVLIIASGALGAVMARRRQAGEVALRTQGEELGQRLDALQRALEDERVISRVGENVARLAHGLKNAVHSLRGFVGLIEPQLEGGAGTRAALAGLHAAIDDLEKLARLTLANPEADDASVESPRSGGGEGATLGDLVSVARVEVETANPGVAWTVDARSGAEGLQVGVERETLLELLVILMRNAVEAMGGQGAARVELDPIGSFVRIAVSDAGPGFPDEVLGNLFQPGYTTKEKGSGFGLFLARRIADDHGGSLEIGNLDGGGACVQVALPAASGA